MQIVNGIVDRVSPFALRDAPRSRMVAEPQGFTKKASDEERGDIIDSLRAQSIDVESDFEENLNALLGRMRTLEANVDEHISDFAMRIDVAESKIPA